MNKLLKFSLIILGLTIALVLVAGMIGAPNDMNETVENTQAINTSDDTTLTTEQPTSTYQDEEWSISVNKWMPILSEDMTTLGTYATSGDYENMYAKARLLKADCKFALEESQGYTVSPKYEDAKKEYELSLDDFTSAARGIQYAVEAQDRGDADNATKMLNTANVYIKSGTEHMTNAGNAL